MTEYLNVMNMLLLLSYLKSECFALLLSLKPKWVVKVMQIKTVLSLVVDTVVKHRIRAYAPEQEGGGEHGEIWGPFL